MDEMLAMDEVQLTVGFKACSRWSSTPLKGVGAQPESTTRSYLVTWGKDSGSRDEGLFQLMLVPFFFSV